jgi:hypothetical protein
MHARLRSFAFTHLVHAHITKASIFLSIVCARVVGSGLLQGLALRFGSGLQTRGRGNDDIIIAAHSDEPFCVEEAALRVTRNVGHSSVREGLTSMTGAERRVQEVYGRRIASWTMHVSC